MKVFKPLEEIRDFKNLVFLAGPCPRAGQKWEDWRKEMIEKLSFRKFNGDVANPTNPDYDTEDPNYYDKQCMWETTAFHYASAIVFWIDRNDEHPALTTNIEFGIWSNKAPESLIIGIPEGSEKCDYIKWVCKKKNIICVDTIDEVIEKIFEKFNRKQRLYFTSDTHFSSSRHIEMSHRPFKSIEEMDLEFISNWNKRLTADDVMFHLGDFGDIAVLDKLNFGNMFLLKGNYERKEKDFDVEDNRVFVMDKLSANIDGETIYCVHEPLCSKNNLEDDDFFLFGHIHEKSKVKRNGFNVGIDANNFCPVDVDTVRFYKNAILKHYDDNVFCDKCI